MILTAENAFVGAKISNKEETFFVYKVNNKSFYAGKKDSKVLVQPKGMTWVGFMKQIGGEKYTYGKFEISEGEAGKKNGFIVKESEQKHYLIRQAEQLLAIIYKERVIGNSTKTCKVILPVVKGIEPVVIDYNNDGWFLISMRDAKTYFFYNPVLNEYRDYHKEDHINKLTRFPDLRKIA